MLSIDTYLINFNTIYDIQKEIKRLEEMNESIRYLKGIIDPFMDQREIINQFGSVLSRHTIDSLLIDFNKILEINQSIEKDENDPTMTLYDRNTKYSTAFIGIPIESRQLVSHFKNNVINFLKEINIIKETQCKLHNILKTEESAELIQHKIYSLLLRQFNIYDLEQLEL